MTSSAAGYTTADLARRWRVGQSKILRWITSGQLIAVNVATHLCGRPMWRVTPEAVEMFERQRASTPTPKPPKRKKKTCQIDFYPD